MEVFKHKTTPKKTTSQPSTIAHQKKRSPHGRGEPQGQEPTHKGRKGRQKKKAEEE